MGAPGRGTGVDPLKVSMPSVAVNAPADRVAAGNRIADRDRMGYSFFEASKYDF